MRNPRSGGGFSFSGVVLVGYNAWMSNTLNIQVADELKAALAARASDGGYASVEAYVEDLVRVEAARVEYGAPGRVRAEGRADFEAMIREGLESPAREMEPADWQEMRRRLIDRHRQSKAG